MGITKRLAGVNRMVRRWRCYSPSSFLRFAYVALVGVFFQRRPRFFQHPIAKIEFDIRLMVSDYEPPDKLLAKIREEHRAVEQIAKKAGLIK